MDYLINDSDPLARIIDDFSGNSLDTNIPIPQELLINMRDIDRQIVALQTRLSDLMRAFILGRGINLFNKNANFNLVSGLIEIKNV